MPETKDAWIARKIAEGKDPAAVRRVALDLEAEGKFTGGAAVAPAVDASRSSLLDTPPDDPSVAAFDDPRTSSSRARSKYAADDPGGFALEVERLRNEREAQIRRDEPERTDAADVARSEADAFRTFPGERSGEMADLSLSSPGGRLLFGYPTRLDQDETPESKRQQTAREMQALVDASPGNALSLAFRGKDEPIPLDAAKAAGMDREFTGANDLPWYQQAAGALLTPTLGMADTAMQFFGVGDLEGVASSQDIYEAMTRYGSDADVQRVTSPQGMADLATRAAVKLPVAESTVAIGEAIGAIAPEDAKRLHAVLRESRPMEQFDALTEVSDPAEQMARLDRMTPRDLPESANARVPSVAEAKRYLKEHPEVRNLPGLSTFATWAEQGREEAQLTEALRSTPIVALRMIDPQSGASLADVQSAAEIRKSAREQTGGDASAALEKTLGAMLLNREGDRYVPSTVANIMRLAGTAEEMLVEADVSAGWGIYSNPVTAALALAVKAGASDDTIAKLDELRIPTKAGLDAMLASGAYDDALDSVGMGPYRRRYDPADGVGYLARVLTNVALPEAQGAGYADIGRRAGIGEGSTADTWLNLLDIGADTLVPFEEMVGAPVIGAGKAAIRARRAAKVMPAGYGLRGAFAGAAPSTYLALAAKDIVKARKGTEEFAALDRKLIEDVRAGTITAEDADLQRAKAVTVRDGDALTAVSEAVSLSAKEAIRRGANPLDLMPSAVRSQWADVVKAAGADPEAVRAAVAEWSAKARPLYLDTLGQLLRAGGTPETIALRSTPEYRRVRGEIDDFVASGNLTPADADAQMALLEVAANVATAYGIDTGVTTAEDFFKKVHYRVGGRSGADALSHSREFRAEGVPPEAGDVFAPLVNHIALKRMSGYRAAKEGGDVGAALDVVRQSFAPQDIEALRQRFGGDVTYLAAPALERGGQNVLPIALADFLADATGARSEVHSVFQTNKANHTGADKIERLVARPLFDGPVTPGAAYVIVDDVVTRGGTVAEIADHIRAGGGRVVGVVALAKPGKATTLVPDAAHIAAIQNNPDLARAVRDLFHVEPAALTRDEAAFVVGTGRADVLRARAAEAIRSREARGGSGHSARPEGVGRKLYSRDGDTVHGSIEARPLAPTYYSALRRAVENLKGERFDAKQLRAALLNAPGVKADEIEWTGLDRFLDGNAKPSKSDVLAWLDENAVTVEEKVLGVPPERKAFSKAYDEVVNARMAGGARERDAHDAVLELAKGLREPATDAERALRPMYEAVLKADEAPPQYASYTLPGGENYREVLFKLPYTADADAIERKMDSGTATPAERAKYADLIKRPEYRAPHFGSEGTDLLAHARVNDRVGPNGEKILFVEELQSDLHQAGREKGYTLPDTPENRAEVERLYAAWQEKVDASRDATDPADIARLDAEAEAAHAEWAGMANRVAGDGTVPAAPFAKTWPELVFKRLLRMAAEGNYDGIAWTPGIVQVRRYEDATRAAVDEIRYVRGGSDVAAAKQALDAAREKYKAASQEIRALRTSDDANAFLDAQGRFDVAARDLDEADRAHEIAKDTPAGAVHIVGTKSGREVYNEALPAQKVPEVLGKEIARKVAESPDASGSLTGSDLTIGGEGMKGFYDDIVPKTVNKLTKKGGARVTELPVSTTAAGLVRVEPVEGGWALRDRRGAVTGTVYDDEARARGVAERINAQHVEPAHYLPLTPQLRDTVLHEGQPLFSRTGTTTHGTIEGARSPLPTATSYLIRLFHTGDYNTLLHEHGHALRFIFGDGWMDDLARHFDNAGGALTRKGEEQVAEAMRWYFRTRLQPDGRLRAKLDDAYVALQNAWLKFRRDPELLPAPMAARWDDVFRPDEPLRPAAVSVTERLLDRFPTVRVGETSGEQIAEAAVLKAGQRREAQRVGTRREDVRTALGLRNSQTEASALDLYTKAFAYVATEQFRKGWGLEEPVRLTTRTVVPASRAQRVADTVKARALLALGGGIDDVPLRDGVLDFTPAQAAGWDGLVREAIDSPMGADLPRDIVDGTAPWTPENYNRVVETLIDHHAGVGSRRSRVAEAIPQSVGYALVGALAKATPDGFRNWLKTRFVVPEIGEGYIDPAAREVLDGLRRDLGRVHSDVYAAAKAAQAGNTAEALQAVRGQLVPPVAPPAVSRLASLTALLRESEGVAPDVLFAALDQIQTVLGAGVSAITDLEYASLTSLRQIAPVFDAADVAHTAILADAAGVLSEGLRRRWATVEDSAGSILLAAAGSDDRTILKKRTAADFVEVYDAFYGGEWDRLFAFTANLGHETGMEDNRVSRVRPGVAVLEMIARLRSNEVLRNASGRLAEIGIRDTDALTAGRAIGTMPDRSAYVDRVQHYIELETAWNAVDVRTRETDATVRTPPPPVGGHDLDAYTAAHRLLAQWGFKYGKGNEWERRVLPDGAEVLLPKMIAEEIDAAVDRVAKVGTAYGQAPARTGLAATIAGNEVDLPLDVAPSRTLTQTVSGTVGAAVNKLISVVPATLALSRVGLTTGLFLPNPAYYVGNAFGGMLQMYAGLGAKRTATALTGNPAMVTALVSRMWGEEGFYKAAAKPVVDSAGRVYDMDALLALAQREGLSSSFVAAETARGLARDIKALNPPFWRKMMAAPEKWQDTLMNSATAIDNFYRVSTFVDAIRRGESASAAAELARKVGFDYGAMTDFEKRYARNSVMFYSYMRRNLDLFYDTLLTNPSRVLGQLRLLRGVNQWFLGEEGEIVTPSYLDGRLLLAIRSAAYQGHIGHDKGDVVTVAPPLPIIDAVNLHADLLDTLTGAAGLRNGGEDSLMELFGRTTPMVQLVPVLALNKDPFSKRELQSYNKVPANLVEWDRMTTGGIVVDDFLGVRQDQELDPSSEEAPGQPSWHASNARRWWLYHTVMQFPGAGRSLDTLAAMDRANLGIVETAVEAARTATAAGLTPSEKVPGEGDTMIPRAGLTATEELAGLFAVKPVRLDTAESAKDRLYKQRKSEARKARKDAEAGAP